MNSADLLDRAAESLQHRSAAPVTLEPGEAQLLAKILRGCAERRRDSLDETTRLEHDPAWSATVELARLLMGLRPGQGAPRHITAALVELSVPSAATSVPYAVRDGRLQPMAADTGPTPEQHALLEQLTWADRAYWIGAAHVTVSGATLGALRFTFDPQCVNDYLRHPLASLKPGGLHVDTTSRTAAELWAWLVSQDSFDVQPPWPICHGAA